MVIHLQDCSVLSVVCISLAGCAATAKDHYSENSVRSIHCTLSASATVGQLLSVFSASIECDRPLVVNTWHTSTSLPVELLSDSEAPAWRTSPVETAVSPVDISSIPAGATVTLVLGRSRRLDRLLVTRSFSRRLFASCAAGLRLSTCAQQRPSYLRC